jgi:hypothetical protein
MQKGRQVGASSPSRSLTLRSKIEFLAGDGQARSDPVGRITGKHEVIELYEKRASRTCAVPTLDLN